ncbi:hypothetical protein [uncultured Maribacter sp.]|uniref:hypothetical protein n=1 Tax=uncultured Maribacter sp. TaxID=431308 RepID=UPI0026162DB2|nr:hypothetical protein [uncultured Maribacter sp.]
MLIDASPKYTNSDLNYKRENPIVVERFVKKSRNISNYSHTQIAITTGFSSTTDYSYMSKKIKSAPEKLKRAMFKTSSRGIAIALQKK